MEKTYTEKYKFTQPFLGGKYLYNTGMKEDVNNILAEVP